MLTVPALAEDQADLLERFPALLDVVLAVIVRIAFALRSEGSCQDLVVH